MLSYLPKTEPHPDLIVGLDTSDDAGVYRISDEMALVQSVDYFTPIVDNPYDFGRIAAANALSDIYAMGGTPITVMNLVGFPIYKLDRKILAEILRGGAQKVQEAGATLIGGHSIDDVDPKFGMAVTGVIHPQKVWANSTAKPGDALILTKPIGMGITSKAIKEGVATPEEIAEAVKWMAMLNKYAADVAHRYPVSAVTDVTGFGLLGHALEMVQGAGVGLELYASREPVLDGTRRLADSGLIPSGSKRSKAFVKDHIDFEPTLDDLTRSIFADAVTSGGLLVALPEVYATEFLHEVRQAGMEKSEWIGKFTETSPNRIKVWQVKC